MAHAIDSIIVNIDNHPAWSDAELARILGAALAEQLRAQSIAPEWAELQAREAAHYALRSLARRALDRMEQQQKIREVLMTYTEPQARYDGMTAWEIAGKIMNILVLIVVISLPTPVAAQPQPLHDSVQRLTVSGSSINAQGQWCYAGRCRAYVQGVGLAPYLVLLGGQAADAITTVQFLSAGGREANQWMGQDPTRLLVKKAAGVAVLVLIVKVLDYAAEHTQSRTIARVGQLLSYGAGGVGAWAALHNHYGIPGPALPKAMTR